MQAIRRAYPHAHLALLTSPGKRGMFEASEVLNGAPWLDEIITYYAEDIRGWGKTFKLIQNLRKRKFDVWFELPIDRSILRVSLRNMLFAFLANARWAAGWRINTIRWWLQVQSELLQFPNEVERLLRVVGDYAIPTETIDFDLPITQEHQLAVSNLLDQLGLSEPARLIALAPGAKRSTNRWPPEMFAEVGQYVAGKGYHLLVLGSASERELCQQVCDGVGGYAHNMAGSLSIIESAALLSRCELLVTNDSGPQHVAAAVGTPCISLFSFSDVKGKWWPYGKNHTVLQKWVSCHTCFREECPYDNKCVKSISIEDVCSVLSERLAWS
jgi:heptosyltransferase-2